MGKISDFVKDLSEKGISDAEILASLDAVFDDGNVNQSLKEVTEKEITDSGQNRDPLYQTVFDELKTDEHHQRLVDEYKTYINGFFVVANKGPDKPCFNDFSDYMMNEVGVKSVDNYTWTYRDGFYRQLSEEKLQKIVRDLTHKKAVPTQVKNYIATLRADSQVEIEETKMLEGKINCENGVLDLENKKLYEHDKSMFFKYKLPIKYDPDAKCPKFLHYLDQTFSGDVQMVEATFKIFGYCLYGGEPFLHKSFILFGEGRNGKSVWLHVLRHLLGLRNVSTVSMSLLGRPFSVVQMDGMLANICGELPTGKLDSELFKTAVGGEYLTASKKNKDEFGLKIDARLVFATNKFPVFADTSTGMWEKLFIMPFERYIPPNERNPKIFDELMDELPGILNYAIKGLESVLNDQRINEPDAVKACVRRYRMDSDAVFAWMEEKVTITGNKDDFVSIQQAYEWFMVDEGSDYRYHIEKKTFAKRVRQYLVEKGNDARQINRSGRRGFAGIDIAREIVTIGSTNELWSK